jgi:hypothetical protein
LGFGISAAPSGGSASPFLIQNFLPGLAIPRYILLVPLSMLFPPENPGWIAPAIDVQEIVRQFNDDEAVWRCFVRKRARRKLLARLLRLLDEKSSASKRQLDELDWLCAEREARPVRAIGRWIEL